MAQREVRTKAWPGRISPEDRLLVCCANIPDERGTGESVSGVSEILRNPLDWDGLIRKSIRHGVATLLHTRLDVPSVQRLIPDHVSQRLKSIYYASAIRAVNAERQAADLLSDLAGSGMDAILLKGLFLAKTLYRNVALRPVGDIDLLIRYRDVRSVDTLLRRSGYIPAPGSLSMDYYLRVHFHMTYLNPERPNSVPLEVHWDVQDRFNIPRISVGEMWSRVLPWELGSCATLALHPEDLLAYLCYHADKHTCFSRYIADWTEAGPEIVLENRTSAELLWYADILRLLHELGSAPDWDRLAATSRRWGIEGSMYATLAMTGRLFGAKAVGEPIARLHAPRPGRLKAALYSRLMSKGQSDDMGRDPIAPGLLRSGFALQFRPIRVLDLWDYLFPDRKCLPDAGSPRSPRFWGRYIEHVIAASIRLTSFMGLLVAALARKWFGAHRVLRP